MKRFKGIPCGRLLNWPALAGVDLSLCSMRPHTRDLFADYEVKVYPSRAAMLEACDKAAAKAELGQAQFCERPLVRLTPA